MPLSAPISSSRIRLVALAAALALVPAANTAHAAPLYYGFTGVITAIDDSAGIIAPTGLGVGSAVTFVFHVDLAASGSRRSNDGTLVPYVDNATWDYFWADFIEGSVIDEAGGGTHNQSYEVAEWNLGQDRISGAGTFNGYLNGRSNDEILTILDTTRVSTWTVGTEVTSTNTAYDASGFTSTVWADLTVTYISATLPEPATPFLLAALILGIAAARRQ